MRTSVSQIQKDQLMAKWKSPSQDQNLEKIINSIIEKTNSPTQAWRAIYQEAFNSKTAFVDRQSVYEHLKADWNLEKDGPFPVWIPSENEVQGTHIYQKMKQKGFSSYEELLKWSQTHRDEFWSDYLKTANIQFQNPPSAIFSTTKDVTQIQYLPDAKLNITESCFLSDSNDTAIVYQKEKGSIQKLSYQELDQYSNRVANSLIKQGFQKGDRIAINMVMTIEAVAIYLGIIKAGMAAVSIADSFAPEEIKTRLRIAEAKAIFTQDVIIRGGKSLPLYEKVQKSGDIQAIVLPAENELSLPLRESDLSWSDFLVDENQFETVECDPHEPLNILFSSGTTGDPKAIPWTHSTALKCAMDGYYHHDIQGKDVVAWPTNLGWMMGPWLIYAALINKATIALYYGAPLGKEFGEFVQNSKISMLGLVPSIVKAWRKTKCMEALDWSAIRCFSSTGECSNADDYFYLMSLANNRPVIEYCGGTEIGGGYITGTFVQSAAPATFTTPTLGLDFYLIDENQNPSDEGEVFIVPPSIGLSTNLLNRDHYEVYFKETPHGPDGETLRRHGDQMQRLASGFLQAHGRADDTMNLGGIKVSSAEIERVVNQIELVHETAAIAVSPKGGGPSLLVIYCVSNGSVADLGSLKLSMQNKIKEELNPLFKIEDLVLIDKLPRTASNKVMRRVLRAQYQN